MKNKLYACIGFLLVIVALYAYWQAAYVLPQKIELYTKSALHDLSGATYFDYARKERSFTRISFYEIKLDKDGFSRIEQIDILYSPFFLFFTGTISEVDILVPDITLSINEREFHTIMEKMVASPAPQWIYALKTLSIEGGRINFLTQNMGALRISFAGLMRSTDQKKSLQFQLNASQKQLSGEMKLSGTLHPNRNWHIDSVLEDGRLDHDSLQLTRITGQMTVDSAGDDGYFAKSEFSIGGLRAPSGHAVSDMAASYELNQKGYNLVVGGKALGFNDIELGLAYNSGKPDIVTGTIFTPSLPGLVRYYKGERAAVADIDKSRLLQNIFLTYELPKDQLWAAQKQMLLRFSRLDIADFTPVFNGYFYGNGALRGALKVQISKDRVVFGGLALSGQSGNFVFEKPLLQHLSKKIDDSADSAVFMEQVEDFHYEELDISVTGADPQTNDRNVTIKLRGGQESEEKNYIFSYKDDFLWLWNALLGYPED